MPVNFCTPLMSATNISGRRIFLTGGAGFIASHLIERLIENNRITVFDNNKRNALKDSSARTHRNLSIVEGDVRRREDIAAAIGDCDTVIHCAAIAGIDSVGRSPLDTMEVNLMGTYNLLEIIKERKLTRVVDFSTSEVYGPYIYRGTENDLTSQGPVGQTRWTYAVSKLAAEHLSHTYHHKYGLPVVSVRPFNIYGPRQVGEGAIQKFIIGAVKNEDLVINGEGSQIRAWCYVSDFVDAVLNCLERDAAVGEVFNIGNPKTGITISELAQAIIRLSGSSSRVIHREALGADVEVRVPSIEKAERLLGYNPKVDLATGILSTIEWFRAHAGSP